MSQQGPEDKQLLASIVDRDLEALESLHARYSGRVFAHVIRVLRDPGAAEEVTQDVFFNVWRKAASYSALRGSVTAWLFTIAHNRAIDELRRRRRQQSHLQHDADLSNRPSEAADGDPTEYAKAEHERSQIKAALTTLRPEQREVVVLAYFGGFTHSEIANHLKQPLGTVKTRIRLAIKKLRVAMGPQAQESVDFGI